ncbi:hypothetical protein HYT57_01765 [Candidatus Woesearchaeota archaeon]|nr:hypothetical protein [Candidatus Woesearchaeota archaeon]
MEIIAKISRGSKMDQVYIPKNRSGFSIGSYVILKQIEIEKPEEKPFFYNIREIEPIKLELIDQVMKIIDNEIENYENIIITGSFLESSFNFNDIDVVIVTSSKINQDLIKKNIEDITKISTHIIALDNNSLIKGLSIDPLYQMMLSKCVAKKRIIYKIKTEINYKLLDLHLLKSKTLMYNFDILNGNEKYYLVRNMIAIYLFLQHKKLNHDIINKEIKKLFGIDVVKIKQNLLDKKAFLHRYNKIYKDTFNKIMDTIDNGSKQK